MGAVCWPSSHAVWLKEVCRSGSSGIHGADHTRYSTQICCGLPSRKVSIASSCSDFSKRSITVPGISVPLRQCSVSAKVPTRQPEASSAMVPAARVLLPDLQICRRSQRLAVWTHPQIRKHASEVLLTLSTPVDLCITDLSSLEAIRQSRSCGLQDLGDPMQSVWRPRYILMRVRFAV